MASITLEKIKKIYGKDVEAVKNLSLEIFDKEFLVLVGPSGCGKSTLLRMIAGLEEISAGELKINGIRNNETAPGDRDIAMVFQSYALYPHMTAYQNMAFGLKNRKISKTEIERRVNEAAQMLDITDLLSRKPKAMSGGQRQRVALGRALVREPEVFLLDEPLSNLDAKLRSSMRTEIIKLHEKLQTTFVYVTHDQTEAMTMGERIVVMKDGIIQQVGPAREIYSRPANLFVACFIGTPQMNLFDVIVVEEQEGRFLVSEKNPKIKLCRLPEQYSHISNGERLILGIRPEHIVLSDQQDLNGEVDVVENLGSESYLHINFLEQQITLKVSGEIVIPLKSNVSFIFRETHIHLFDAENKNRL